MASFNHLSDEILLQVFQYISITKRRQFKMVCKRWCGLMDDYSLYRCIRVENDICSEFALNMFHKYSDIVRSVVFVNYGGNFCFNYEMVQVLILCNNLKSLKLVSCNLQNNIIASQLNYIIQGNSSLQTIVIKNCKLLYSLLELYEKLHTKALKEICIRGNEYQDRTVYNELNPETRIISSGMYFIKEQCKVWDTCQNNNQSLTSIEVELREDLGMFESVKFLNTQIIMNCKNLRVLYLKNYHISTGDLINLCNLNHLTSISLVTVYGVSANSMMTFFQNTKSKNIEKLKFLECDYINGSLLTSISKRCPNLCKLYIDQTVEVNILNSDINNLLANCGKMKKLFLSNIGIDGLHKLKELPKVFPDMIKFTYGHRQLYSILTSLYYWYYTNTANEILIDGFFESICIPYLSSLPNTSTLLEMANCDILSEIKDFQKCWSGFEIIPMPKKSKSHMLKFIRQTHREVHESF